ncbi:MAG: leucine--tRNA ligase [Marinilabiliales bacterium]|nr:MAG: leucine--tRNA ligase [Marinilabiliales bacterium]
MGYDFGEIESKWQKYWAENKVFKAEIDTEKPKYYVLDMFPYPSGAGLHVGHPLGYIASDIYSRYKRHKGFNVLHPMGYDAYGLPAEQYAIQTGTHPEETTEKNIKRYRKQLDQIGFSFDWDREVRTSDPKYYKWTQWTFIQLFNSWYNKDTNKAESLDNLVEKFEKTGSKGINAAYNEHEDFTSEQWKKFTEYEQQNILMNYRLAYLKDTVVNWCPALGTVLANDEVKDGLSERGGHPVERKLMKQWLLRITAYSQRLLDGLDDIDWSEALKESQRNWIGRSEGASIDFKIKNHNEKLEVFTTRPDTIFGATFMVIAPEHELMDQLITPERKQEVEEYVSWAKNRSERERMTEVKKVTGVFTGSYAINPISGQDIPIWTADYVLAGYGTGAIMAVPGHDSRDFAFARHFELPIIQVVVANGEEPGNVSEWDDSYDGKEGAMINSGFINGMQVKQAIAAVIKEVEEKGIGYGTINYRLRDAIFSRQRYWGEPFPIYYKDGMPYALDESELPLKLPAVDKYLPTEDGKPPLARAENWTTKEGYPLETNTMPGFAGSSAYYLRYMDPLNDTEYFSKEANNYWKDVDLYVGGDEHAAGHLIYSRFWNKFLFDLGLVCEEEPFKKLINQGKIQGRSNFVYRIQGTNKFVSHSLRKEYDTQALHVDINLVHNDVLDLEAFKNWLPEYKDAEFILEDGKYVCGYEVEKMSKSKHNVQNPDNLIEKYGADTLRVYEMFLGPLEQDKPWDTNGIEGVFRFLRKFWRLFFDEDDNLIVTDDKPADEELKTLHKTIKKVDSDILRFSFNTGVSAYMICVNELSELKCHKRSILEPLTILLSPYAPHICEEIWQKLGYAESISTASYPIHNEDYLSENSFEYPVSFNGKMRFKIKLPVDMPKAEIEKAVVEAEEAQKWLDGKTIRKIIVVPNRIVNLVVG